METGRIRLGTAAGWPGSPADPSGTHTTPFYPAALKRADYLTYYATQFDTVKVDSTFYRVPGEAPKTRERHAAGKTLPRNQPASLALHPMPLAMAN
jgi:uncharacterized protein YecE (DUF72 family)